MDGINNHSRSTTTQGSWVRRGVSFVGQVLITPPIFLYCLLELIPVFKIYSIARNFFFNFLQTLDDLASNFINLFVLPIIQYIGAAINLFFAGAHSLFVSFGMWLNYWLTYALLQICSIFFNSLIRVVCHLQYLLQHILKIQLLALSLKALSQLKYILKQILHPFQCALKLLKNIYSNIKQILSIIKNSEIQLYQKVISPIKSALLLLNFLIILAASTAVFLLFLKMAIVITCIKLVRQILNLIIRKIFFLIKQPFYFCKEVIIPKMYQFLIKPLVSLTKRCVQIIKTNILPFCREMIQKIKSICSSVLFFLYNSAWKKCKQIYNEIKIWLQVGKIYTLYLKGKNYIKQYSSLRFQEIKNFIKNTKSWVMHCIRSLFATSTLWCKEQAKKTTAWILQTKNQIKQGIHVAIQYIRPPQEAPPPPQPTS